MAFNLNKNDAPEASATTSSKFELSKTTTAPDATTPDQPKKSNVIGYLIIALLLIGGATWYFLSSKSSLAKKNDAVVTANKPAVDTSYAAQPSISTNTVVENDSHVSAAISTVASNSGKNVIRKIPVLFASGATNFSDVDPLVVNEILKSLSSNSELSVEVLGYASSEGSMAINQSISQARANAFKAYLISKSIAPNRIIVVGKGTENPIASNITESGRKKNRRVEVKFHSI
ncbi:OmpA family protein [Pedobacter duraquae]|uniref:Outer membrane protein OmpA-like peptidoglycan-associated protein n=1 Tax=Pedobacter duraquae TaxID=425511 RepID=A0A4R6INZ8_9SPHI|nr:OmpA family protein [Pedobacter duraquae]TDO23851.1 outer membrane protein OmpA-like peptidoglycan-associated protein [Pedobacter duraquae]